MANGLLSYLHRQTSMYAVVPNIIITRLMCSVEEFYCVMQYFYSDIIIIVLT